MGNIIIKNISKSYGEKNVLSNLSFEIGQGERVAVMGNSGSGKTTLLRIMAGLESADSGEIKNIPEKISFVFQENRLCEDFNAIGNVKFVTGKSVSEDDIAKALTALGLSDSLKKPVKELSGGMKRRVAIARALLADFDLLILDEPFKGLDADLKQNVMNYVAEKSKGKILILVTHDLKEAEFFTNNIITI